MTKPAIRRESRFFDTPPAFDAAAAILLVLSRLDRGIESSTEMLPLKMGRECCT